MSRRLAPLRTSVPGIVPRHDRVRRLMGRTRGGLPPENVWRTPTRNAGAIAEVQNGSSSGSGPTRVLRVRTEAREREESQESYREAG